MNDKNNPRNKEKAVKPQKKYWQPENDFKAVCDGTAQRCGGCNRVVLKEHAKNGICPSCDRECSFEEKTRC